ncbi:zinc ribbon domain-containing protein [Svornostia abyssi]|uniref:Zinc ribbon domain-containing protein n=1 Tax=Svornostia abyssi TaxID=2898438 RepID=A0ABY5PL29_9ACTN|nr:zinc ribbon domain-containing protein [Parviterribacteraceae bacterium J379]
MRSRDKAPEGMVPAEQIAAQARKEAASAPPPAPQDQDLVARRDKLIEQFTVQQAELGGVFYEMAIRDHIRLDVLTQKAAALQRVDHELAEVERALRGDEGPVAGNCPSCGARHAAEARFCSRCGYVLQLAETPPPTAPVVNGNGNGAAP